MDLIFFLFIYGFKCEVYIREFKILSGFMYGITGLYISLLMIFDALRKI